MARRALPWIVVCLLAAAVGCRGSGIDAAPWVDDQRDTVAADGGVPEPKDGGGQSPDAADAPDGANAPDASDASNAGAGGAYAGGSGGDSADAGADAGQTTPENVVPPDPEPVPNCPTGAIAFDTPPPPAPTGFVSIDLSAWLQPVGVRERAVIQVLTDQYQVDTSYNGELVWTLPDGVEIVDSAPVSAGQAEVTFRFTRADSFALEVGLSDDPRSGRAELVAYETQLPVWELAADPVDLAGIYADPLTEIWISGVLTINGVPLTTTLRLHGGSSRDFSKKSFRFNLASSDPAAPTYGTKLILRAEYNDKSLLRNWLALRLVRGAATTTLPTPRSKLVHFRINDRYYGLMHNVERVDKSLLRAWAMPTTGSLYESDPPLELADPGGNLTPLSPELYPQVYQHHAGLIDYLDLRTLIEDTLTLPDAEFAQVAETEIVVDEYIEYLAALAAIQDQDQVRKNFYLYRDPDAAAGWRVMPWDLDLTFGHLWSEQNDVLDETIVTDGDIFVGAYDPARGGFYNQLTDRVLSVPAYRARFRALVQEMLETSMARTNADMLLQAAIRCATPDIVADTLKRADNAEYLGRVTEILDFLDARRDYVLGLPQ